MEESHFTSLAEVITARRSVKKYLDFEIPQSELDEILTLATYAPSSWNLQHWRFLIINSKEQKDRILPIAYNQQQIIQCSAVVVILGDLEANLSAENVFRPSLENNYIDQKTFSSLLNQINNAYQNKQVARDEATINASLAAMQLMLSAKAKGYDTCPMGGFDGDKLISALNIPSRFIPVMLVTIGKAATPGRVTSRFPLSQVVIKESF